MRLIIHIIFILLITGCSLSTTCKNYDFGKKIQPVPKSAIFIDSSYYTWGASMIRTTDGTCHLFYSRWPLKYGKVAWVTHSEIAHATADNPLGPYLFKDVALLPREHHYWDGMCTHNPTIHYFNGKYYLYYMGNTGNGISAKSINMVHRNNQRIGVAVAKHPNGPWMRFDTPLVDISPDSTAYDALMVSNPTVAHRWDGKYILIYKAVGKKRSLPFGGPVVHMAAISDSPEGPFVKQEYPIFSVDGVDFPAEDPYIWVQDKCFYAIVKDMKGYFTNVGQSLALFSSADGLSWKPAKNPIVTSLELKIEGDDILKLTHLERPQLYLENGMPAVLFCAADTSKDFSFNIHIPLK